MYSNLGTVRIGATQTDNLVFFLLMEDLKKSLADDLNKAFSSLVDAAGPMLYWGLRRMSGNPQEAEDLTQETFVRAYKALSDYPPRRIRELKLMPWLWTVAMNLGRNHLRDKSRRPVVVPLTDKARLDAEPPDQAAWDRRFSALSTPQRNAVVLRHVVGLPTSEIASALGRPEGTVKADIHRGLERLRKTMEEES